MTEIKFTIEQWDKALRVADKLMKDSNGHSYQTILKTRCIYCGASPKVKTKCRGWFMTFTDKLLMVLGNKNHYQIE